MKPPVDLGPVPRGRDHRAPRAHRPRRGVDRARAPVQRDRRGVRPRRSTDDLDTRFLVTLEQLRGRTGRRADDAARRGVRPVRRRRARRAAVRRQHAHRAARGLGARPGRDHARARGATSSPPSWPTCSAIHDRGRLVAGAAADVVVFDLDTARPGPLRRVARPSRRRGAPDRRRARAASSTCSSTAYAITAHGESRVRTMTERPGHAVAGAHEGGRDGVWRRPATCGWKRSTTRRRASVR